jgi:kynurenine formamidase
MRNPQSPSDHVTKSPSSLWTSVSSVVLVLLLTASAAAQLPYGTIIDLTHNLSEKAPNWEGTEKSPFEATTLGTFEKDGYFSRRICLPEHFATHLDAPAHFSKTGWTVEQIPVSHLIAPLFVLDVTAQSTKNVDYAITPDDVLAFEKTHGRIAPNSVVFARTGWSKHWDSMKDYRNADAKGVMHFPGFSPEAAKLLVDRGIVGLGIDTLTIDIGASPDYPAHRYVLPRNIYQVENVADLSAVPATGATVIVAPTKLEGGSGGPVRVLAIVPK